MSDTRAAYRYARAIFEAAEEAKQLNLVADDFEMLKRLLAESRELAIFLKSPVINVERRKSVLLALLDGKVAKITMTFVELLATKDRQDLLSEVIRQFFMLRDARNGIMDVTVRAAVSLSKEQEAQLADQLRRVTKKQPRIRVIVDRSLIGGWSVQFEDTVWDGSVRHQLELMREMFAEGRV